MTLQSQVAAEKAEVSELVAQLAELVIDHMPGDQISDGRLTYTVQTGEDDNLVLRADDNKVPQGVALNQAGDVSNDSLRVKMSFVKRFEGVGNLLDWRSATFTPNPKVEVIPSDDPGIAEDAYRLTRLYSLGKEEGVNAQRMSEAVAELAEFVALTSPRNLLIGGPWDYTVVEHEDGSLGLLAKHPEADPVDLTDATLRTPEAMRAKQSFFSWFEKVTGEVERTLKWDAGERRYVAKAADAWIRGTGLAD